MSMFVSGSVNVPAAAAEMAVTGLSLPFVPTQVVCSLRQPDADADYITCAVSGAPTADGFSVSFSAPTPSEGYVLDWCAACEEAAIADASSLAVGHDELVGVVARFLGYDPAHLTEAQTSEVDSCIQSGVRNFYYPPKMEGVDETYEWSFLRMACSVTTTADVADYRMADGFGKIHGEIYFSGDDRTRRPLRIVPVGHIQAYRLRPERGAPRCAAFRYRPTFGSRGQYVELMLYPTPDRAYQLDFAGDADTGRISASKPFPLGGPSFAELVVESCLASAEQRSNDEAGLHTERFRDLLVSMIAKDRGRSGASYGFMGDAPDFVPPPALGRRFVGGLTITYGGVPL